MTIEVETTDGVRWLWLARPEQRNAVDSATRAELLAAIDDASSDDHVRVVAIAGRGGNFSAGADLREHESLGPADLVREIAGRRLQDAVADCPRPVVAMVEGACLGGGFELALAADIRVASTTATFALPEVRVGLLPGGGGTQRLPRLCGAGVAARLVLTGESVDGTEAHRLGIVELLTPPDELEVTARTLCARIARNSPIAVGLAKRALRTARSAPLAEGLAHERDLLARAFTTADFAEGVAAFRERRAPNFPGR